MTDAEKMDRLMEEHAAKAAKPSDPPVSDGDRRSGPGPLADAIEVWGLDDRDAVLVCPQCGKERTGKVLKSWWIIAEKRGDTNPWWKLLCTPCADAEEADTTKKRKPPEPEVSQALELELPIEE